MHIPYTTDVRPDTGLTNPKLGIWLFLASEVMLFGSLFSAYALLRSGSVSWPDQSAVLSVPFATLNTIILISSSITMVLAWVGAKSGELPRFRLYMGLTLLLGAAFMTVKAIEYNDKFSHGLLPSTDNFLGLYFTMTGVCSASCCSAPHPVRTNREPGTTTAFGGISRGPSALPR